LHEWRATNAARAPRAHGSRASVHACGSITRTCTHARTRAVAPHMLAYAHANTHTHSHMHAAIRARTHAHKHAHTCSRAHALTPMNMRTRAHPRTQPIGATRCAISSWSCASVLRASRNSCRPRRRKSTVREQRQAATAARNRGGHSLPEVPRGLWQAASGGRGAWGPSMSTRRRRHGALPAFRRRCVAARRRSFRGARSARALPPSRPTIYAVPLISTANEQRRC
jgi:hypothetical protein